MVGLLKAQGPLKATEAAPGAHWISGAGANVLLVAGPNECVLVDSGAAAHSLELGTLVSKLANGKPVAAVFNTCFDEDATGGNAVFHRAGAKIIAHDNTKQWMANEWDCDWRNRRILPRKAEDLPTETFFDAAGTKTLTLKLAGEEFQYGTLPFAHTDGDIYVYAKRANILMGGGVVAPRSYPVLDYTTGGWIGGLRDAFKTLTGIVNAQTKVIGATGPMVGKGELDAEGKMVAAMYQKIVGFLKQGYGATDMIAAKPTAEFDAIYGDPTLFMKNIYPGVWAHAREMGAGVV